jgi:hypothetical protein
VGAYQKNHASLKIENAQKLVFIRANLGKDGSDSEVEDLAHWAGPRDGHGLSRTLRVGVGEGNGGLGCANPVFDCAAVLDEDLNKFPLSKLQSEQGCSLFISSPAHSQNLV